MNITANIHPDPSVICLIMDPNISETVSWRTTFKGGSPAYTQILKKRLYFLNFFWLTPTFSSLDIFRSNLFCWKGMLEFSSKMKSFYEKLILKLPTSPIPSTYSGKRASFGAKIRTRVKPEAKFVNKTGVLAHWKVVKHTGNGRGHHSLVGWWFSRVLRATIFEILKKRVFSVM